MAEAFFGSLKRELVARYRFADLAETRVAIATWIHRSNTVRLHSSLGYVPPVEYELCWACEEAAVAQIQTVKQMGGSPRVISSRLRARQSLALTAVDPFLTHASWQGSAR